jgi:hypothetical protein
MAGRGPQTFKKRQKEQARKERQDEKRARRLERKIAPEQPAEADETSPTADSPTVDSPMHDEA